MRTIEAEPICGTWNEGAEQNVLALCLTNTKASALLVDALRPSDFYRDSYSKTFAAIRHLVREGRAVDPVILSEYLHGREWFEDMGASAFLHSLADLRALVTHATEYAKIVRQHAVERETRRIGEALSIGRIGAAQAVEALREISTVESPTTSPPSFIEWAAFWERDRSEPDWVFPDVLARRRGHALYAGHKVGKSLFQLFVAGSLATAQDKTACIYLDYEMSEDDVHERLSDMGYGPETDLSRLKYALLPSLPPLDTLAGAAALLAMVDGVQVQWPEHHLVVVIDTIGRAVEGDENSADTVRAFYAHTGIELKRRGVTWVRLDHGGKDPSRGPRGSSGKGDDVDVVWRLERTQNGVCLVRDVARMHWIPERVTFVMTEDPLDFRRVSDDWPAGTGATAEELDGLEVPLNASASRAQKALKDAGKGTRKQVVLAALRWRREHTGERP